MRFWQRNIAVLFLSCVCVLVSAQTLPSVGDSDADAFLTRVSQNRWLLHSACLSFSGNALYLSARHETDSVYELYLARRRNGQWQLPEKIASLATGHDHFSPTVSPDELTLYFIEQQTLNAGTRKQKTVTNLFSSARLPEAEWSTPAMTAVASGTDSDPLLLHDGRTLCYTAKLDKDRKATYKRYYIHRLDKYNWTLPVEVPVDQEETALAEPVMQIRYTVTNSLNAQPLPARIDVYNAVTQQRVASYPTAEDGLIRLTLNRGIRYKLDVHADGFSHCYDWRDCERLHMDSVTQLAVALTPELSIKLRTFDRDNMAYLAPQLIVRNLETGIALTRGIRRNPLGDYTMQLPIGRSYSLALSLRGYADTTFYIDTRRDVRFADTELDVLMRGSQTRLTVRSVDDATGEAVAATMQVVNRSQEQEPLLVPMPGGTWQSTVHCATSYRLLFSAAGYFFCDTIIETPDEEAEMTVIVRQHPLRREEAIVLEDIHFEFSSYLLTEDSYDQLRRLAELMRQNPNMRVQIAAHTDNVGSDAFNQRLSELRGESVVEYLVHEEGIRPDRLEAIGYGKSRPLVDNDTEEHRAVNRRVEFTILDL